MHKESEKLSFDGYYQKVMQCKYANDDEMKDLLDRSGDINNICRIIRQKANDNDYYSLALTGDWGSGKSYVLTRVEKELKSEFLTIHYDCWKNDFYEEPLYGILYSLVQYFNSENNPDFTQSKYYEAMKEIIFGVVKLTPLANVISKEVVSVVSEAFTGAKETLEKEQVDSNIDFFQKGIHSVLDKIHAVFAAYIAYENKKIIIAVDELDRCLPNYALKVLNRLHHICYGSSIIIITAVNNKELLGCINTAFGKESDDEFSNRYLDRFFDYSYNLSKGNTSDLLDLWNGLENFDDFIISKDFLNFFCNALLRSFSMREKKKLISNVCSFHKIVSQDNHDKLTYALLCAELMFAIKYFYLNDCHWDYVVGPFGFGPYDESDIDPFGNPQPKKDVFTLFLSKPNGDGKHTDVKIRLGFLTTKYNENDEHYNIPIDSPENRVKAFFAEPCISGLDAGTFFVCGSEDPLFKKEVNIFNQFKRILQENR